MTYKLDSKIPRRPCSDLYENSEQYAARAWLELTTSLPNWIDQEKAQAHFVKLVRLWDNRYDRYFCNSYPDDLCLTLRDIGLLFAYSIESWFMHAQDYEPFFDGPRHVVQPLRERIVEWVKEHNITTDRKIDDGVVSCRDNKFISGKIVLINQEMATYVIATTELSPDGSITQFTADFEQTN